MATELLGAFPGKKPNHQYNFDVEFFLCLVAYVPLTKGDSVCAGMFQWEVLETRDLETVKITCEWSGPHKMPYPGLQECVQSRWPNDDAMMVYLRLLDIKTAAIQEVHKRRYKRRHIRL